MVIVADADVPLVHEAFSRFGDVRLVDGRHLHRAQVADADALVIRSVSRVDAALVEGTPVRFVGTATIGVDHVDTAALAARGIRFASAAGCNAVAVSEYVIAALAGTGRLGPPVGVVGFGNVGRRVVARLRALGVDVAVSDPPLEGTVDEPLVPLAALAGRPVLTVHVPRTTTGPHATVGLIDAGALAGVPDDGLLVQTSRGGVVDEAALLAAWAAGRMFEAVIDVWADEPRPDPALVRHPRVRYATPHVAGHSLDGKLHGTRRIYDAFCAWRGVAPTFAWPLPGDGVFATPDGPLAEVLPALVGLEADTAALRRAVAASDPGRAFDRLRADRPTRWDWAHHRAAGWTRLGFGSGSASR